MAEARRKATQPAKLEPRLKILVSSAVYGYEDLLESIYALLETFGYHVMMSHTGMGNRSERGIANAVSRPGAEGHHESVESSA